MSVTPQLIRRLPKADLHSHIDGSIPAGDLLEIARKTGRKLKTPSGEELSTPGALLEHVRGSGYRTMLPEIVSRFYPIVSLMQSREVLREVGVAYVKGLRAQNVAYAEGRFAPQYHTKGGLTYREIIESMAEGLDEGEETFGVKTGLIVAIGREVHPPTGLEVARAAVRSRRAVALDLGGPEESHPPEKFKAAFQAASEAGLRRTVHAGEGAGSLRQNLRNIRTAILGLRAHRVGHAIDLSKDHDLTRTALDRGVGVEMNPVSNLTLGRIGDMKELGIALLLKAGVAVTVNSDDPALWPRGSINDVLFRVCSAYGFRRRELDILVSNSFQSSFAPARLKKELEESYAGA
jgi:adenosine deaminase